MKQKLPNFLIAGAAKSGTTSLYSYLNAHPEIFMSPIKEPLFFIREIYGNVSRNDPRHKVADKRTAAVASWEDYLELFAKVSTGVRAIGEASAPYLYHYEMAIKNIKHYLGDPRIIIILRNPIERAFSSYCHIVGKGAETCTFEEFLECEEQRKAENWDVLNYPVSLGMYSTQVKAYQDNFSRVKVIIMDDLKNDPEQIIQELCVFLGVNDDFRPDTSKVYNKSAASLNGPVRNTILDHFLSTDNFLKTAVKNILCLFISREQVSVLGKRGRTGNEVKLVMTAQTRKRLGKIFSDDIMRLQELLGRDLSHWS